MLVCLTSGCHIGIEVGAAGISVVPQRTVDPPGLGLVLGKRNAHADRPSTREFLDVQRDVEATSIHPPAQVTIDQHGERRWIWITFPGVILLSLLLLL